MSIMQTLADEHKSDHHRYDLQLVVLVLRVCTTITTIQ